MLSGPALYVDHDDQPNAVYVKQSRTKVGIQVSYLILCILYPVFNLQTQGYPTHCTGGKNNHQLRRWWWGGDKAEVNLTRFWMKKKQSDLNIKQRCPSNTWTYKHMKSALPHSNSWKSANQVCWHSTIVNLLSNIYNLTIKWLFRL